MKKNKQPASRGKAGEFGPENMDLILGCCGIKLGPGQIDLLWKYHKLLRRHNPELNLTRIHRFENMVVKLYADSILPVLLTELPSPLLDLGTGPGMPGIPLKIARPDLEIVLAETRANRAEFLKTAIAELGLSGITVYGRAIHPGYEQPAAGIITRAVEHMGKTLDRIRGCLEKDGLAIFMKGPGCDNELAEAVTAFSRSFVLAGDIAYTIPGTTHQRRLVTFRRKHDPPGNKRRKAMEKHHVKQIQSAHNSTFKELKKLLSGRGAKKQKKALIAGKKHIEETVSQFPGRCLAWITKSGQEPPPENLPDHAAWYRLEPELFDEIDALGTNAPLLLAAAPEIPPWDPDQGLPAGCSVLIAFQDPENTGAAIRSAVAFGADRVILLAESAYPFHVRAIRASGGAVMRIKMLSGPSIHELPDDPGLVALSAEGIPISDFEFPATFGLLPGMEGPGLPRRLRARSISIPIRPEIESLNAAAAAAIALYKWSEKKEK